MVESRKRSLAKAITWRIIVITVLTAVTWLFTSDAQVTVSIVIVANTINVIVYYIHERLWERVKWGRKPASRKKYVN